MTAEHEAHKDTDLHHSLPLAQRFPVPHSLDLPTPSDAEPDPFLRPKQVAEIVRQIHALPTPDYETTRDAEMERLQPYFDMFARLWGVDLKAIATTRMQLMRTVMLASPLWAESIIGDEKPGEARDGMPFFDRGKRKIDDLVLSATYRPKIAGYRMAFSVLKVPQEDDFGSWELDYPLFSLPPDVLQQLLAWQKAQGQSENLDDNPILTSGAQLISRRIHDWFHAAVLYDTQSRTNIFQGWSDDSFHVKHLFNERGMINYEFLANWSHYTIWQKMFDDDPAAKKQVIAEAQTYLDSIAQFERWMTEQGHPDPQSMADFLSFLGTRSLFDIMPFDDPDIQHLPRFARTLELLEEKEKNFLHGLYTFDQQLPFDRLSDKRLSVQEIIDKYMEALREEERAYRLEGQHRRMLRDIPDPAQGDVSLNMELAHLPDSILMQLKDLPLDLLDPSMVRHIRRGFDHLRQEYGDKVAHALSQKVHISQDGYAYLHIKPDDVDMSHGVEVVHSKRALLIQIPYDAQPFRLMLKRRTTLLKEAVGAEYTVHPGEVIIVNIQDPFFAHQLIEQATIDGEVDSARLLELIAEKGASGMSDVQDSYPYPLHKADITFGLSAKGKIYDQEGRRVLTTGLYETTGRKRKALRIDGPVAVLGDHGEDMKISEGALVEDTHGGSTSDVFPVVNRRFNTNYSGARLSELPHVHMSEAYKASLRDSADDGLDVLDAATQSLLNILDMANKIQTYGITPDNSSQPRTVGEFVAKKRRSDTHLS